MRRTQFLHISSLFRKISILPIVKVRVISIGKTNVPFVKTGIEHYLNRLKHYVSIEWIELSDVKHASKLDHASLKKREFDLLKKYLADKGKIILLDEHGKNYSSVKFAQFIEEQQIQSLQQLTFFIGGAYGFSSEMLDMKLPRMALSQMTFTHQMIRLLLVEQMYRAFTIIKNENYHH